ncbi:MAG TPA: cytochrome P450 [Candidatus Limnocylindrales bacterium]|nr:cytochrome P450 [Candidatus Limnocylindrales bacterium]
MRSFPFSRPGNLDPPPEYARLRASAPVTRVAIHGREGTAWLLTGYQMIKDVLADRRFLLPSSSGVVDDPSLPQNPPRHTRLRRLAEKAFTPARAAALRPFLERTAGELIDAMTDRPGPADLMAALAMPLPIAAIAELFGVRPSEVDGLRAAADPLIGFAGRADEPASWLNLDAYISGLIETRGREPGDDLITALTRVHDGAGDRFTQAELVSMGVTLVFLGYPKVAHTIATGVIRLLSRGDLSGMANDTTRVRRAVEEILRLQPGSSIEGLPRLSTQDMSLAGVDIPAGASLIVSLEAANRDPAVFPDPDRFDPSRGPDAENLAFGYGVHRCLGEPLARLELEVVFEQLAARVPKLRLATPAEQLPWRPVPGGEAPARVEVDW